MRMRLLTIAFVASFLAGCSGGNGDIKKRNNASTGAIDNTPPDVSSVTLNDGIEEWSTINSPSFIWNNATDVGTGVDHYDIAIGTTPGGTQVRGWTSVGNVTQTQATSLSLSRGTTYYASVRAVDSAGNVSGVVQGDGWVINSELWVTDGTVNSIIRSENKIYLSGSFFSIGPWSGGGAPVDVTTGLSNWSTNRARVAGNVYTAISDGMGGLSLKHC